MRFPVTGWKLNWCPDGKSPVYFYWYSSYWNGSGRFIWPLWCSVLPGLARAATLWLTLSFLKDASCWLPVHQEHGFFSEMRPVLVTETCFEYWLQNRYLSEEIWTAPVTPHGFAKGELRKSLEMLQEIHPFTLRWVRLFYLYDPGKNPKSLLSLWMLRLTGTIWYFGCPVVHS